VIIPLPLPVYPSPLRGAGGYDVRSSV
jgi:hypothetical protein